MKHMTAALGSHAYPLDQQCYSGVRISTAIPWGNTGIYPQEAITCPKRKGIGTQDLQCITTSRGCTTKLCMCEVGKQMLTVCLPYYYSEPQWILD